MIWLLPHPTPPSPTSKLSRFHSLPKCRRSSLLTGDEGGGWGRSLYSNSILSGSGGGTPSFPPHPRPISQLIRGYSICRRRNRYSGPLCLLGLLHAIRPFLTLSNKNVNWPRTYIYPALNSCHFWPLKGMNGLSPTKP
jgi:hypothetical protein